MRNNNPLLRNFLLAALVLSAAVSAGLSLLDFAPVKALIDARSADGEVETYTAAFHADVQHHLRTASIVLALCALVFWLLRRAIDGALGRMRADAKLFRSDVAAAWQELRNSTGRAEVVIVALLILLGAVLRGLLLHRTVIYDEAFTCTYYAVRPVYIILSDYSYPNNHILHTLLVKLSMALFGWGEVQARLPAFIAGLAVLPFFWAWVRATFGSTAALFALGLVALSGPLIEYSALARGYSLTWLFLVAGLWLSVHFIRTGNLFTAFLLALVNAFGLWTVPTMLYGTVMLYLFSFHGIWKRGGDEGPQHLRRWVASGLTLVVITLLLYAPVMVVYGPGQLFYDDTMGPRSWEHFVSSLGHKFDETGTHFTLEAPLTWGLLLLAGPVVASFVSRRYRWLLSALLLAVVPLVMLQHMLAPPRAWDFALFVLFTGTGIAFARLLEVLRAPTWLQQAAVVVLAVGIALPYRKDHPSRANRFDEARETVAWLKPQLGPNDRVAVYVMWLSPIEFYMMSEGLGRDPLYRAATPGSTLWLVVGTEDGTRMDEVLSFAKIDSASIDPPRKSKILPRSMIFAARIH